MGQTPSCFTGISNTENLQKTCYPAQDNYVEGCCLGTYLLFSTKGLSGNVGMLTRGGPQREVWRSRVGSRMQEVIGIEMGFYSRKVFIPHEWPDCTKKKKYFYITLN